MAIVTDYKIGVKRETVNALKPIFGSSYPDPNLAGKIYVGLEYPIEEIRYPAIYVTYTPISVENVGVGSYGQDDQLRQFLDFKFKGRINLNVLALNPLDRDMLAAGVSQMLTIGKYYPVFKDFFTQVSDGDWVSLHVMTDTLYDAGENIGPVPWDNQDERLYSNSFSLDVFGQFCGDAQTGDLIQIGKVNVYPYRSDLPIPSGTADPAPWS